MNDLATVDLEGVEILEAGVRIHGQGSPPEGDLYSVDDLRAMASAAHELRNERRPPAKIGHTGNLPAVGWLDNIRVAGTKLLADVRDVPRKFADLIHARAYGSRSAGLSRVRSQHTGRQYDWVVTGLAWLGGKLPAVRTLDDVIAFNEDDIDVRRTLMFEEGGGKTNLWQRIYEADPEFALDCLDQYLGRDPAADAFWRRQFVET